MRSSRALRLGLIILAAGLTARLLLACMMQLHNDLERFELERAAISLAQTGTLGNPYAIATGPSAHIAPGYAAILAGLFSILGTGTTGEIAKIVVSTFFSVLTYAFFPKLAESLGLNAKAGFWAGLAASLLPIKTVTDLAGDWEAPLAAASLVLCTIGMVGTWRLHRLNRARAIRLGLIGGITLLISPAFITLYVAGLIVGGALLFRTRMRDFVRFAAVQTACVALLLTPWAIRNYMQLGSPIMVRSNTGLEMHLSNNDYAGASETENYRAGLYHRYHPLQNRAEAEKVRALGEVEYNARLRRTAIEWIRTHPERFLTLCVQRAARYWFPVVDALRTPLLATLSIASLAGAVFLLRRDATAGWVLLLPLIVLPLPHYLVHVNTRHKYPIDWIGVIGIAILAASVRRTRGLHDIPVQQQRQTAHGSGE